MAIDFPSTPSDGQVIAIGNAAYTYNAAKQLWDIAQLKTALAYNYIVNPAMDTSFQNTGATPGTVAGYYPADQWWGTGAFDGTFELNRVTLRTPRNSTYRVRFKVITADAALAAGQYFQILQRMEGLRVAPFLWGTANAKQALLRFGWKSPAGNYSAYVNNFDGSRSYPMNFTISAGQANADTEQTFIIPGCTTGTWNKDNTNGIQLGFIPALGTSFHGTDKVWNNANVMGSVANTNGLATVNNIFEIFDVGFYLDPNLTGRFPPWRTSVIQSDLDSARYWDGSPIGVGLAVAATTVGRVGTASGGYLAKMRTAPTLTFTGNLGYGVGASIAAPVGAAYGNIHYWECDMTSTGLTTGRTAVVTGAATLTMSNARM